MQSLISLLKEAREYTLKEDGGIAVIIARHPCLIRYPDLCQEKPVRVMITEECNGCMYCVDFFECPALQPDTEEELVRIDRALCIDCGVCIHVCPREAIVPADPQTE
jgi:indolepyruvate ferredoxin oxidoreductase alpha subunit